MTNNATSWQFDNDNEERKLSHRSINLTTKWLRVFGIKEFFEEVNHLLRKKQTVLDAEDKTKAWLSSIDKLK